MLQYASEAVPNVLGVGVHGRFYGLHFLSSKVSKIAGKKLKK